MSVAGVVQPAASATAGSVLYGISNGTYIETTGSNAAFNGVFLRGAFYLDGKTSDLPTASDIGGLVAISDNSSVKHTQVSNDLLVKLLEIDTQQAVPQYLCVIQ